LRLRAFGAPQMLGDQRPRRRLVGRGHRIFEIEQHQIGAARAGFGQLALRISRREQQGACNQRVGHGSSGLWPKT
jgi:hypothetical protein